jgi:hypothetical protein
VDETEIERMVVRLMGDGSQYMNMLKQAQSQTEETARYVEAAAQRIEGFAKSIESFGRSAISILAGLGATGLLQKGFAGFSQFQDTMIGLKATLEVNGRAVESTTKQYVAFADQMRVLANISGRQTLETLKLAESFKLTGASAERAAQDAMALADVSGSSAQAMIRLTAAVAQGDIQRAMMFSRMVPQLRGVKNEAEFMDRYQKLTSAGFAAMQEKAQTAEGRLKALDMTFQSFLKDLGKTVAEGVKPFVEILIKVVEWLKNLNDGCKLAITSVLALVAAALLLGPAFRILGTFTSAVLNPFVLAVVAGGIALAIWVDQVGGIGEAFKIATDAIEDFISANQELIYGIVAVAIGIGALILIYKLLVFTIGLVVIAWNFLHMSQVLGIIAWVAYQAAIIVLQGIMLVFKVVIWLVNAALTATNLLLIPLVALAIAFVAAGIVAAFIFLASAAVGAAAALAMFWDGLTQLFTAEGPLNAITKIFGDWYFMIKKVAEAAQYDLGLAWQLLVIAAKIAWQQIKDLWPPLWKYIKDGWEIVATAAGKIFYITFLETMVKISGAFINTIQSMIPFLGDAAKKQVEAQIAATKEQAAILRGIYADEAAKGLGELKMGFKGDSDEVIKLKKEFNDLLPKIDEARIKAKVGKGLVGPVWEGKMPGEGEMENIKAIQARQAAAGGSAEASVRVQEARALAANDSVNLQKKANFHLGHMDDNLKQMLDEVKGGNAPKMANILG